MSKEVICATCGEGTGIFKDETSFLHKNMLDCMNCILEKKKGKKK